METMKAARWHAAKDIRVEEINIPIPNDNKVKVASRKIGYQHNILG